MDTDNGTSRQFFITEKILSKRNGGRIPDRVESNKSNDQSFYGYDQKDGTTDWYTKDGTLDSTSKTPRDDED